MFQRSKHILSITPREQTRNQDGEIWDPMPSWVETKTFRESQLFVYFDLSLLETLTTQRPGVANLPPPTKVTASMNLNTDSLPQRLASSPSDSVVTANLPSPNKEHASQPKEVNLDILPQCSPSLLAPDHDAVNNLPPINELKSPQFLTGFSSSPSSKILEELEPSPSYSSLAREYGIDFIDSVDDPEYDPDEETEESSDDGNSAESDSKTRGRGHSSIKGKNVFGLTANNQKPTQRGLVENSCSSFDNHDELQKTISANDEYKTTMSRRRDAQPIDHDLFSRKRYHGKDYLKLPAGNEDFGEFNSSSSEDEQMVVLNELARASMQRRTASRRTQQSMFQTSSRLPPPGSNARASTSTQTQRSQSEADQSESEGVHLYLRPLLPSGQFANDADDEDDEDDDDYDDDEYDESDDDEDENSTIEFCSNSTSLAESSKKQKGKKRQREEDEAKAKEENKRKEGIFPFNVSNIWDEPYKWFEFAEILKHKK